MTTTDDVLCAYAPDRTLRAATPSIALSLARVHTWGTMRARLVTMLRSDTRDTWHNVAAVDWYVSYAPSMIMSLADRYGFTYETVAAIVAVMSAMMPWDRNVTACEELIAAYVAGARGTDLPGVTRNYECIRKAERLLGGADPESTIVKRAAGHVQSWKTLCFYYNLCGMTDRVTVDVWMWRVLSDDMSSTYRPEGWHYMMCESVIMSVAEEFGVTGPTLQSVAWSIIRPNGAH